jgi:hypothetical protein
MGGPYSSSPTSNSFPSLSLEHKSTLPRPSSSLSQLRPQSTHTIKPAIYDNLQHYSLSDNGICNYHHVWRPWAPWLSPFPSSSFKLSRMTACVASILPPIAPPWCSSTANWHPPRHGQAQMSSRLRGQGLQCPVFTTVGIAWLCHAHPIAFQRQNGLVTSSSTPASSHRHHRLPHIEITTNQPIMTFSCFAASCRTRVAIGASSCPSSVAGERFSLVLVNWWNPMC